MSEIIYLNDRFEAYTIIRESADHKFLCIQPVSKKNAGCWVEIEKVAFTGRYI